MIIIKAIAVLIVNFIMYLAFGSFFTVRRKENWSAAVTITVGFFAYYALFFVLCMPFMFTYRPLDALAKAWIIPCGIILVASAFMFGKDWYRKLCRILENARGEKGFTAAFVIVTVISVVLVISTYNFTLDAAYYVASVSTNVDTNMINVYDPFTGAWLDHFELRYAFATYYVVDSVVCFLTNLPALVETRTVMSAVVMIIVNMLYVHICSYFYEDKGKKTLMYIFMTLLNFLFISLYTTSNFLMTRTYEGKSVVGNIAVLAIFVVYMHFIGGDHDERRLILMLFAICFGAATVSSTANMVIPAAVFVLFVPYAFIHRRVGILIRAVLCVTPELLMMLIYVLYVKGYFAIYTFPR